MPYNSSAIPPREEPTGTTQLPLSRVKKMIAVDSDIHQCSNSAGFVITLAAEMFIQYMAEQGHNVVKSERKPRRNVQYRDLAAAVSRHDNLEFLSDIVPKTVPFSTIKAVKASKSSTTAPSLAATASGGPSLLTTNGEGSSTGHSHPQQSLIDGVNGFAVRPVANGNGVENGGVSVDEDEDESPEKQLERESKRKKSLASEDGTVSGGEDVVMHG